MEVGHLLPLFLPPPTPYTHTDSLGDRVSIFLDDYILKNVSQILGKGVSGLLNWQEAERFTSHGAEKECTTEIKSNF